MSGFDFDAHPLTNGQQFFGTADSNGRFMVGLGRARRNNWGEWRQEDLTALLGQAHRLYVTDDPAIKGLLADLAALLDAGKPRWANLNELLAAVKSDPAAQKAAENMMAMIQGGMDAAEAFNTVAKPPAPQDGKVRAIAKKAG